LIDPGKVFKNSLTDNKHPESVSEPQPGIAQLRLQKLIHSLVLLLP